MLIRVYFRNGEKVDLEIFSSYDIYIGEEKIEGVLFNLTDDTQKVYYKSDILEFGMLRAGILF